MTTAQDFFKAYFTALDKAGIAYAILHSYEQLPEVIASDVDYAVALRDLRAIPAILKQVADSLGWWLVKTIQHEVHGFYSVVVNPDDPSQFLQLDVCPHYMRDARIYLRDETLLQGRRLCRDFYIPAPSSEFAYLLTKALSKKKPIPPLLPRLRELWEQEPERSAQRLAELLGEEFGAFEKLEQAAAKPAALLHKLVARHPKKAGIFLGELWRLIQRAAHPCGLRLAVLGPDGVGKSTLLSRMETLLAPCFRGLYLIHFRPRFFERKTQGSAVDNPHAAPARSTVACWLKVLYYFADHLCGYGAVQLPRKIQNFCIIFDRNFDDLIIDPARYRIRQSAPLIAWLRKLLPRPEITFVLDASPEVVHRRKPELALEEIARQRNMMKQWAETDPSFLLISAEEPPEAVARAVCHEVLRYLAAREAKWNA